MFISGDISPEMYFWQKNTNGKEEFAMWLAAAFLSALFAGITAILAKTGIQNTDSDIATALRTSVIAVFSWLIVLFSGAG